jgi:hypothetical protein
LQERYGKFYSPPSNTRDPAPSEKFKSSSQVNTSSGERKVNRKREYLGKRRLKRKFDKKKNLSLEPRYETFKDLQEAIGFVDKTNFTMIFDRKLGYATAILRPRRTGKTMILKMLKEFYSLPRIDVDSYDPRIRDHKNSTFTAKSTFERTLVWDPKVRKEVLEKITSAEDGYSFIDNNMNKRPVIFFDPQTVKFDSAAPSLSEIQMAISKYAIQETFKEHDYVLFIMMVEWAGLRKYHEITKEAYERIWKDYGLAEIEDLSERIEILWKNFGEKMDRDIQDFYRYYRGNPPYDDVKSSLKLLSEILHDFYGQKVLVLADEYDAPLRYLYSNISLDRPKGNAKIMESIHTCTDIVYNTLGYACKENGDNTHKFLMFGVSSVDFMPSYSGFNNLRVYEVFDYDYAEFFSMSKQEIKHTVDFLFDKVQPRLKDKMISNIDKWYNGYYLERRSPIYSIYSTGLYISDCYQAYMKKKIAPNQTDDEWIPEPTQYWTKSNTTITKSKMNSS